MGFARDEGRRRMTRGVMARVWQAWRLCWCCNGGAKMIKSGLFWRDQVHSSHNVSSSSVQSSWQRQVTWRILR
jgi:hypothetical protein